MKTLKKTPTYQTKQHEKTKTTKNDKNIQKQPNKTHKTTNKNTQIRKREKKKAEKKEYARGCRTNNKIIVVILGLMWVFLKIISNV